MFKTTKSWMAWILISSAAIAGLMILLAWLLKGTPYSSWAKDGLTVLWCAVIFAFVGNAPEGSCRIPWRRKTS
jgi:hypothetical protein